jgi:Fur family ferric uptake transcriptional regulator
LRHTRQADAVDAVLVEADGFRSAQDVYAELRSRGEGVGLSTVYRRLNLLAELGRADVVHPGDGETQYRLCGTTEITEGTDHHHHVVCRACGRSVEVSGPEVEEWADRVAGVAGYTDVTHTLEVFGLCPEHSRQPRGTARGR